MDQIARWLESPLARALLATECNLLKREMPRFQGHFCLHMLPWPTDSVYRPLKLNHQVFAFEKLLFEASHSELSEEQEIAAPGHYDDQQSYSVLNPEAAQCNVKNEAPGKASKGSLGFGHPPNASCVLTDFTALPFRDNSIDVIFLHHCLEFHPAPHSVLREASRVLLPSGALIVLAFNPYSIWGIRRLLWGWRSSEVLKWKPITQGRVEDWLTLLDYRVERKERCMYRWPIQWKKALESLAFLEGLSRLPWLPGAGVHITMARKQVAGLTPLRPKWVLPRPRRPLIATTPKLPKAVSSSHNEIVRNG